MKPINNESDFKNLLQTQNEIIIFCYHNWSGYSVAAKQTMEKFEKKFDRNTHLIDASIFNSINYFTNWLNKLENKELSKEGVNKLKGLNGYGETFWILKEKVIGFEPISHSFNSKKLEEKTVELFTKN